MFRGIANGLFLLISFRLISILFPRLLNFYPLFISTAFLILSNLISILYFNCSCVNINFILAKMIHESVTTLLHILICIIFYKFVVDFFFLPFVKLPKFDTNRAKYDLKNE